MEKYYLNNLHIYTYHCIFFQIYNTHNIFYCNCFLHKCKIYFRFKKIGDNLEIILDLLHLDKHPVYYLVEFLDKFKATVYRQVMFSEFEYEVHKYYEEGKPLNVDVLNDLYYELNKKNFAPVVKVDENIKYEWSRIPHFYTSFYVYKYATGFISALLIVDRLLNEDNFKDKYIKFLSSGHIKSPLTLLKELGIDLEDNNTLKRAFNIFKEKLELLKTLENGE